MEFLGKVVDWFSDPANWTGSEGVPTRLLEHLWYTVLSLAIASLIAIPLGLFVGHTRRGEFLVASLANMWRALPSFAVLGIAFIAFLPAGLAFTLWPTILAMVFLAIPPILTNTYVGIQEVDAEVVEAARGVGMSGSQVIWRVEVPLAAPLMVTGLRSAAVQVVATATLAAFVAAGGLGTIIRLGYSSGHYEEAFAGALLVTLFAVLVDALFGLWARRVGNQTAAAQVPIPDDPR